MGIIAEEKQIKHKPYMKVFLSLGVIIFLLFAVLFVIYNSLFNPETYEKSSFTEKEIKTISDCIYIDSDNVTVDKVSFSHAKDSVFVFYISGIQADDIISQYEKISEASGEITCRAKNNTSIKCVLDTESNSAVIKLEEYNDKLYKMMK